MEESGLVVPLGDVVLRTAARQARAWQRQHGVDGLPVRVNLSTRQLQQPDIVDRVAAALADAGLPASSLVLEITETVLMSDPDETIARLKQLRALGIGLTLDDFGTGFSSLAYLKDLPLQELKLAKKFVLNMADANDEAIVRSTVQLGRNLGLRVLAEGVEDEAIWRAVQALGCDLAQGYHLGRPVPASELDPCRAPERGPVAGRIGAATEAFAA
jgi:diguanylate cyclase